MKRKALAIIVARGGSKRIPHKNIRPFLGRPLIEYSIEAAIKSDLFSRILVSTDDDKISSISIQAGAEVPFKRSEKNSDDFSTTNDVVKEVLTKLAEDNEFYDDICCLYPTAPFVNDEKLRQSYELFLSTDSDAVIPVTAFSFPIQRAFKISNEYLTWVYPEHMSTRSQDLEPCYHDAGQFYWFKNEYFQNSGQIFSNKTTPFILEGKEVQDIDTLDDWEIAQAKYKALNNL